MDKQPPKYAQKFLYWILKKELAEEVLGDLEEKFYKKLEKESPFQARRNYWYQTLNYLRPFAIKNNILNHLNPFFMFKNYFKVTYRLFSKNKTYLLINSLGLGVAVACCLAAYLFFAHNIEFDNMHQAEKVENIFKVHAQQESKTGYFSETMMISAPLASAAATDIAGIKRFTRYIPKDGFIQNEEKTFSEAIHFADATFFDLFDFPVVSGDLSSFKEKHSIILTAELAKKLFAKTDPIGEDLVIHFPNEKELLLSVGAVIEQMPQNNSFVYDAMIRFDHFAEVLDLETTDWSDWRNPATFFELVSTDIAPEVNQQLAKYIPIQNEAEKSVIVKDYRLEPFLSGFKADKVNSWANLRMSTVPLVIFGVMAFMILLIACFNLTNTSIAMSHKRLKEIGVRKAIGATRRQIIFQFLMETMLTIFIALIVGLSMAKTFLLPEFTAMFNLGYGLVDLDGTNLIITLLMVLFLASLLAGIYPALFNSSLNPVNLVKGDVKLKGTNWFTRSLVTIQFALSVIFLIGGTIFFQNNLFMDTIDFGYDSDQMIAVEISSEKEFNILAAAINNNPKIENFAGTHNHISFSTYQTPVTVNQTDYQSMIMRIGTDYLKTAGLKVISGEATDLGSQSDAKGNVLVNEAFINKVGIKDPLNQQIIVNNENRQIVGVVANHKERGERAHIDEPFVYYRADPKEYTILAVSTKPADLAATYLFSQKTWQKNIINKPFVGRYQSDILLKKLHHMNRTMSTVFIFLTFLGILLSLAGIYAMASLNIAKRTKEIGIRKVLGASVKNIIALVNREFVIILTIASIIGACLGYFLIRMMITEVFPHHVPLEILPIAMCGLLIFVTGLLVTSSTIFRVAISNPVKALKSD